MEEIRDQFWQLCPLESHARFLPSIAGVFTVFVLFHLFVLSLLMEDIIPIFEDVKQVLFLVMSRWFITWNPAKKNTPNVASVATLLSAALAPFLASPSITVSPRESFILNWRTSCPLKQLALHSLIA